MERISRRKVLAGIVVSNKMNKSCVVLVETYKSHPIYKKRVKISKKYLVHDKNDATTIGDRVRIRETRPLSARKHFDLVRIIEKAK